MFKTIKIRITSEVFRSLKQLGFDKYPEIKLEKIPTQYGNGGYGAIINDGGYLIIDSPHGKQIINNYSNMLNNLKKEIEVIPKLNKQGVFPRI